MGLSTRILLRIYLPAVAILIGVGTLYHHATRAQSLAAAERQLHASPAERAAARDRVGTDAAAWLASSDGLAGLDLLAADGRALLGEPTSERASRPEWLKIAVIDGRGLSIEDQQGQVVVRYAVRMGLEPPLVAAAWVNYETVFLPLVLIATRPLGAVGVRIESLDGARLLTHGSEPEHDDVEVSADTPGAASRIVLRRSEAQILAAMLDVEARILLAIVILIGAMAWLLWSGLRAVVLRPVAEMLQLVAAFRDDRPVPADVHGSRAIGELAVLDNSLRGAILAVRETSQSLNELNDSLEERVRNRTGRLEKLLGALRAARDDARAAGRARGALLAHVARRVEQRVTAPRELVERLIQRGATEPLAEPARAAARMAEQLELMAERVQALSRLESGELVMHKRDFNVRRLINQVGVSFDPSAAETSLEFSYAVGTDCPAWLRGDDQRLAQVLSVLLENAFEFTEQGGVLLRANIETDVPLQELGEGAGEATDNGSQQPRPRVRLRFDVVDTGQGMPEEVLERLKESRVHRDGMPNGGLGLLLARRLVERLGGTLGASSDVDRGTTVWCSIPFDLPERQPVEDGATAVEADPDLRVLDVRIRADGQRVTG
jgi:signal transduction histidine kinase